MAGILVGESYHDLRSEMALELRSHVALGNEIQQTNTAGADRVNPIWYDLCHI